MLVPLLVIIALLTTISLTVIFHKYVLLKRSVLCATETLKEIHSGNYNRRLLVTEDNETKELCFLINDICRKYRDNINYYKSNEKKYKDLMVNLSHDIRTPLASMLGYLELLPTSDFSAKTYANIQTIEKKAYQLKNSIDMLFQWTKLDADEEYLSFDTYDLSELSRNILSNWIELLEDNNINYNMDIPDSTFFCFIDATAYERILNNIIKNVIYHSQAKSMAFTLTSSKNDVIICIEDNGIGIENSKQHLVFDRLYRGDSSRSTKGNGLGLAIVKELVSKLNGTIELNSIPNKYTRFSIIFSMTEKQ